MVPVDFAKHLQDFKMEVLKALKIDKLCDWLKKRSCLQMLKKKKMEKK